ncbi:type IV toxin-antitoxin system AbiEi family antitoxin domain-containing protein [Modestobacter sp. SYSU DS0511]
MHPVLRDAAGRQWGAFTAADVRRAGLDPSDVQSALRRGEWDRLRRGVYVERAVLQDAARWGDAARHRLDCAAVLLCLGGRPAVSHASAARLASLVVPAGLPSLVQLTDEEQWRRGRGYTVMRARLPAHHLRADGPFRLTGPARTLVDCGREWALEDAVVAMDAALHSGVVTAAELRAAVLDATHWYGIGGAARAAGLADGRAESPLETRGRLALLGSGLPAPELQVELHGPQGFVARVDAWYDDAAVAIEFDGRVKYEDPRGGRTPAQVLWEEKRREDAARDLGARFVRVAQADLGAGWPPVAERVRLLLATRLPDPRRFRVVRAPVERRAPA